MLFGLQWQGASSKDVLEEYRVRIPGETTLGQCAFGAFLNIYFNLDNLCMGNKSFKNFLMNEITMVLLSWCGEVIHSRMHSRCWWLLSV